MGESILKLQQIRKSFDHTEVLKGVDLEVAGRVYYAVRSLRMRQDHHTPDHCGTGAAGFRKCDPGGKRHYGLGTQ